jgi:hypothetical protein
VNRAIKIAEIAIQWSDAAAFQDEDAFSPLEKKISTKPPTVLKQVATALRNSSTILPDWLKSYFEWHAETLKQLTPENYLDYKYFVLRCLKIDTHCGGFSDRTHHILYDIYLASSAQRMLFIEWDRPCALEEFLLPPVGGLNWTVPEWLEFNYSKNELPTINDDRRSWDFDMYMKMNQTLVDVNTHFGIDHGRGQYDNRQNRDKDEPSWDVLYPYVWNLLFVPSPPVQTRIEEEMRKMKIEPGNYTSLHIRSQV